MDLVDAKSGKNVALFQELSSSPATMQASKAADTYGLFPGHETQQADARQACTQSVLGGTPTWVRLPREALPASWAGLRDGDSGQAAFRSSPHAARYGARLGAVHCF